MRPLYALMVLSTLSLKIGLSSPKHLLLFFLSLFLYILSLPLSFILSISFQFQHAIFVSRSLLSSSSLSSSTLFSLSILFLPLLSCSCRSARIQLDVSHIRGWLFIFVRSPDPVPCSLKIISSGIPRGHFALFNRRIRIAGITAMNRGITAQAGSNFLPIETIFQH